ncbi:MAG: hypothetical protein ABR981_03100 [Candidatus Micrarchaeaceae archaeon]|jgi:hypothetical protein
MQTVRVNLDRFVEGTERYAELFDPEKIGAIHIPNFLNNRFLRALKEEALGLDTMGALKKASPVEGRATQNFSKVYFSGSNSNGSEITLNHLQNIRELAKLYTIVIYNRIGKEFGFEKVDMVNSIGLHKYPKNGHISYHRDPKRDLNLIGIFSLKGTAKIYFALSRDGAGEISYTAEPGDLTLMRGSYKDLKNPFHKVEMNTEEPMESRYSIILRQELVEKRVN